MSVPKQIFLAGVATALLAFSVYVQFAAAADSLRLIGSWHIDKIAHIAGGVFIAAVAELRLRRRILWQILIAMTAIAVGWEVFEFLLDPRTWYFYLYAPDLWRLDTAGDLAADMLGFYGYWVFAASREQNTSV